MTFLLRSRLIASQTLGVVIFFALTSFGHGADVSEISQYGITWKFDHAYPAGQFVNGDWWVVGPVKVVSVTPAPGVAADTEVSAAAKSRYGATSLVDDKTMRNGSMIILGPENDPKTTGFDHQGYDSRSPNYSPGSSVTYPLDLSVNQSLISSISSATVMPDGKLATPFILGEQKLFLCAPTMPLALESVAILTCLDKEPPADAFRPPYVGTTKPIYETKDLRWDLLPSLKPVGTTPDWAKIERLFERPWLDLPYNWLNQYMLPGQNEPNYGREFARVSSIAALMLMLDVPKEQKQKLLIEYVQLGIDLHGIAMLGRQWFSDGGHWQGRKWPILFASIMLDKPELRTFPPVDLTRPVYGRLTITNPSGAPAPTTLFQEDLDTYYGKGGDGQTVLWQIVTHTGTRDPYEENPRANFTSEQKWLDSYRSNNALAAIGVDLAAQLMKAKAIWNHDAFFDYEDRWMSPDEKWDQPKWLPAGYSRSVDPFVEDMWHAYRASAPEQAGGTDNLKWVWDDGKKSGHLEPNPKGS